MNQMDEFDYKKYLRLVNKRKYLFVILALLIMTGVVITSYLLPERYEAKSTVFIEKSVISELVKGIAITPSFDEKLKVLSYTLKSRTLLLKVLNDLDLNIDKRNNGQLESMVREFQDKTDIRLKDKEGLFTITFNNENPRLARDYVNTLVRRYIEENITSKREESYGAANFLAEQITTIKVKLEEAEAKVNSFKRENADVLAQSESSAFAEVGFAQQKIDEIAFKRRQLENMRGLAKMNDPLKTKLAQLQNKQQELGFVYTDNHPEVIDTKNEIAAVKQQLKAESTRARLVEPPSLEMEKISMELNLLRDSERNLRRLNDSRQALIKSIPAVRTGLEELERERNSQKILYEQLMARHGQSEVSKQMEVQDKSTTFRIVDPAILPTTPFSPQRVKIILLGILGSLVASFTILVLLDNFDRTVRNIESLKSLGIQVLAVVPKIENQNEIKALRRRDTLFYACSGAYFLLILATIPIELMRHLSIQMFNITDIKHSMMNLVNLTLK